MKIVKFMQEGGATPAAPAAPQSQEQNQAMEQIAQIASQLIQELGPDAAAMLAQVIMEMLQGAQQEVGATPEEQQFMRCGGKIKKKTCKKLCGGNLQKKQCGGKSPVKKDACGGKTSKCKTKKSCK